MTIDTAAWIAEGVVADTGLSVLAHEIPEGGWVIAVVFLGRDKNCVAPFLFDPNENESAAIESQVRRAVGRIIRVLAGEVASDPERAAE